MRFNIKNLNTKDLSRELTNRLGIYLLAAIVLTVAFWFLLIRPTWAAAQNTKAELGEVRAEIVELEELREATEELRANYSEIRDRRDQILNLLPPQEEEERLLLLLSDYAAQNGIVLGNFVPEGAFLDDEAAGGFGTYGFSVNITGNYQSIVGFIRALEEGARFVDITALSFSGSQTASEAIGVQLSLDAYYQTATTGGLDTEESDGQ